MLEQLPDGLLELLNVPGLGPKTIRNLWEHAGVESIADLEQAIADDALGDVPRLGKKTIANIADSIEFMKKAGERMPIGRALPLAERLIEHLHAKGGVGQVEYAGSLRRGTRHRRRHRPACNL